MSEYNFFGWNRPVDISSFLKLDQQISEHPLSQQIDRNLLSLIIAKKLYVAGDSVQAQLHEQNFDPAAISKILNIQRDLGLTQQIVLNHIMVLFVAQVFQGNIPKAVRLITEIKNPVNRAIYYAMAAAKLYQVDKTSLGNIMMDSALKEDNRKEVRSQSNQLQIAVGPLSDTQSIIAYALASQIGQDNELEILKRIRNYPIFAKTRAHQFIGSAYSRQTALYQSHKNIPVYLSKNNQLFTDMSPFPVLKLLSNPRCAY